VNAQAIPQTPNPYRPCCLESLGESPLSPNPSNEYKGRSLESLGKTQCSCNHVKEYGLCVSGARRRGVLLRTRPRVRAPEALSWVRNAPPSPREASPVGMVGCYRCAPFLAAFGVLCLGATARAGRSRGRHSGYGGDGELSREATTTLYRPPRSRGKLMWSKRFGVPEQARQVLLTTAMVYRAPFA